MMTLERNDEYAKRVDALNAEFGLGFEDMMEELAAMVERDAKEQSHEVVKALLESASEHLRVAGFEIYASYK